MIGKYTMKCEMCGKEYLVDDVKIFESKLTDEEENILESTSKLYDCTCPKCGHVQRGPKFPVVYINHEHKLVIRADHVYNHVMFAYNHEHGSKVDFIPKGYKYIGVCDNKDILSIESLFMAGLDYRAGLISFFLQSYKRIKENIKDDETARFILRPWDEGIPLLGVGVVFYPEDKKPHYIMEDFDMNMYRRILKTDAEIIESVDPIVYEISSIRNLYYYQNTIAKIFVEKIDNWNYYYRVNDNNLCNMIKPGSLVKTQCFNSSDSRWYNGETFVDEIQEWKLGRFPLIYNDLDIITGILREQKC